jgi:RNA polymerase sigma-70 factor (ECF subfamily)
MAEMDLPTDGMLINAVLSGEREQFALLVHRYQRALVRAAVSRLGRNDWADDVVQETFLCALKWLHTYDSRYSFRTWLWTILLNQCHRCWKKRSRDLLVGSWPEIESRQEISAAVARQLKSDKNPSDQLLARERVQLLDAIPFRLPEPQADALRLRFYGELTFPEIAAAMNCSLSTAKNRVKWGLLKMAEFLGPSGEFAGYGFAEAEKNDEGRNSL